MDARRWYFLVLAAASIILVTSTVRADNSEPKAPTKSPKEALEEALKETGTRPTSACKSAATAERRGLLDQPSPATWRKQCFENIDALATSSAEDIGREILRSVGQVVLNRIQRVGWELLRDEIRHAAHCDDPTDGEEPNAEKWALAFKFEGVCKVVETAQIQDLMSNPSVLLEAALLDLANGIAGPVRDVLKNARIPKETLNVVEWMILRLNQQGSAAWTSGARLKFRTMVGKVLENECTTRPEYEKPLWIFGMCVNETSGRPAGCDVAAWFDHCTVEETARDRTEEVVVAMSRLFQASGTAEDATTVIFALARIAVDGAAAEAVETAKAGNRVEADKIAKAVAKAKTYLDALEPLVRGAVKGDWIMASSGAVRFLELIVNEGACNTAEAQSKPGCKVATKLFVVLAAVGNFAQTFQAERKGGDPKEMAATRDKVIEEAIDRLVGRTETTRGPIFSLGGNLAVIGGPRLALDGEAMASQPIQLALGAGLDVYEEDDCCDFHGAITFFDLGQYVSLESDGAKVATPKFESAVSLGLTLGSRVAVREMPLYVGVFGGYSPFVRLTPEEDAPTDDKQESGTFQACAVFGMYVPFIDLN